MLAMASTLYGSVRKGLVSKAYITVCACILFFHHLLTKWCELSVHSLDFTLPVDLEHYIDSGHGRGELGRGFGRPAQSKNRLRYSSDDGVLPR